MPTSCANPLRRMAKPEPLGPPPLRPVPPLLPPPHTPSPPGPPPQKKHAEPCRFNISQADSTTYPYDLSPPQPIGQPAASPPVPQSPAPPAPPTPVGQPIAPSPPSPLPPLPPAPAPSPPTTVNLHLHGNTHPPPAHHHPTSPPPYYTASSPPMPRPPSYFPHPSPPSYPPPRLPSPGPPLYSSPSPTPSAPSPSPSPSPPPSPSPSVPSPSPLPTPSPSPLPCAPVTELASSFEAGEGNPEDNGLYFYVKQPYFEGDTDLPQATYDWASTEEARSGAQSLRASVNRTSSDASDVLFVVGALRRSWGAGEGRVGRQLETLARCGLAAPTRP